jgi:hypothetical protein
MKCACRRRRGPVRPRPRWPTDRWSRAIQTRQDRVRTLIEDHSRRPVFRCPARCGRNALRRAPARAASSVDLGIDRIERGEDRRRHGRSALDHGHVRHSGHRTRPTAWSSPPLTSAHPARPRSPALRRRDLHPRRWPQPCRARVRPHGGRHRSKPVRPRGRGCAPSRRSGVDPGAVPRVGRGHAECRPEAAPASLLQWPRWRLRLARAGLPSRSNGGGGAGQMTDAPSRARWMANRDDQAQNCLTPMALSMPETTCCLKCVSPTSSASVQAATSWPRVVSHDRPPS